MSIFYGSNLYLHVALDPGLLKSLPVTVFNSATFKDGVECVVCLSKLVDGDTTRLLHDCFHDFHLEYIDIWLSSIKPPAVESKNTASGYSEHTSAINNRPLSCEIVMSADGLGEGSSSSASYVSGKRSQIMVIDAPKIALENSAFGLHSSRVLLSVEMKSSSLGSLRSLRRTLSIQSTEFSSRGWDIEQGVATSPTSGLTTGARSNGEGSSSNKNCERYLSLTEDVFFMKEGKRISVVQCFSDS